MSARSLARTRVVVAAGLPSGVLVVGGVLAAARWPAYWAWVAPEQTPMTFVQSVLLFSAGLGAGLLALLAALRAAQRREVVTWIILAGAFAGLMLDERFALHERLRDGYLAPLGFGLPWGSPGDYLLVVYAAVGLYLLPHVLRLLSRDRLATALFVGAVLVAAAVVAADSYDVARMTLATERLQQTVEEFAEGLADALFAAALWAHTIDRLGAFAGAAQATPARQTKRPASEPAKARSPS